MDLHHLSMKTSSPSSSLSSCPPSCPFMGPLALSEVFPIGKEIRGQRDTYKQSCKLPMNSCYFKCLNLNDGGFKGPINCRSSYMPTPNSPLKKYVDTLEISMEEKSPPWYNYIEYVRSSLQRPYSEYNKNHMKGIRKEKIHP